MKLINQAMHSAPPSSVTAPGISLPDYSPSGRCTATMTPHIDLSLTAYNALTNLSPSSALPLDSATAKADMTRVLSLAPTPDFICNISFVLFVPKKNKKGTTTWVPLKSKPDLLIVFTSRNHYTLANFQNASPTIAWSAYILKHRNWPKGSPKLITPNGSFEK
ncbi:hypothetical protein PCANC_07683 [Puccinia coronata f. sp. avenae]|uniref:Uncharacterized protein n=1 Tax=Puccinia coronata f. sp. avenae TaxID=200324 RepID=A0A2N5VR92_9BASI|nr:hypothetical protein PCANC_07683 [Puccinia coronata f. sp. avenae]